MTIHLGTSGWQYRHWRGRFYARDVPTDRWLGFYAQRFATVEVNNTFYRLPARSTFVRWRESTPEGFIVAVKASRYLTHVKRLHEPADPVELFVERARGLGDRLGPVLLQLPPTLEIDVALLDDALGAFPRSFRLALEFRHDSWFRDEVRAVLERRGAALCLADRREKLVTPAWRTADWGYVRFQGGFERPASCYRPARLEQVADLVCATWEPREDVFVYFNNHHAGCAIRDVARFGEMLDARGRVRSRTDAATELAA